MNDKLVSVFCFFSFLLGVTILLTMPGMFVTAYRYPMASEEQVLRHAGSLLLFQHVDELEQQQNQAKTYRVTVTVTRTYVREIQALDKEHLEKRIEKHKRKLTGDAFLESYDWKVSSIEEMEGQSEDH